MFKQKENGMRLRRLENCSTQAVIHLAHESLREPEAFDGRCGRCAQTDAGKAVDQWLGEDLTQ
ncbi:MAG: hypothetical protein ACLSAP_07185 [Oscillospiraceae bacterium]